MSKILICQICEDEFDANSPEKKRAGGKKHHCPSCSEETEIPYLAVAGADGKMAGLTLLSFDSVEDREAYQKAWKNNTGHNKGKSCHLSGSNTAMSGMKFKKVGENFGNENHKGKA
jgi:hypothetical protein